MTEWEKQKEFMKNLCQSWEESKIKKTIDEMKVVKNKPYCTLKESFENTSNNYMSDWERIFNHNPNSATEDGDGSLLRELDTRFIDNENNIFEQKNKKTSKKKVRKGSFKSKKFKENKPHVKPFDLLNPDSFEYVDLKSSIEDADTDDTKLIPKVKKLANQPNKIAPESYGRDGSAKDGKTKVSAGWTEDPNMRKLEDLKKKLHNLECDMSKPNGLDEVKAKKMKKQFEKLKNDIANLSDKFVGDYPTNHYYA